jgi:predicted component of type VI protein secretion system
MERRQVFISYSGHDAFEANLFQFALESLLADERVTAWTFQRDQSHSEKEIAKSLKERVKQSIATVFLVSPSTLESGATQWMELAYADAFNVQTFVLLHHLDFQELKSRERGVPPLLLSSQCNSALEWRQIIDDIKKLLKQEAHHD